MVSDDFYSDFIEESGKTKVTLKGFKVHEDSSGGTKQ